GRGRGRGVPGRGANYSPRALAQRLADRDRHAAILERAGRVGAVVLQVKLYVTAEPPGELGTLDQRRVALVERHDRGVVADRQEAPVMLDQPGPSRKPGRISRPLCRPGLA